MFRYYGTIFMLFFVFVSCSSKSNKKENLLGSENLSNPQNFKRKNALVYKHKNDLYEGQIHNGLGFETQQELSQDRNLKDSKDPLVSGLSYCYQKEVTKGVNLFRGSYDLYKSFPNYWNMLGICYLLGEKSRKALLYFNKARALNSNYVPAINNIGILYLKKKKYEKAFIAFKDAYKKSRTSLVPRYNLAKIFLQFGLNKEAKGHVNYLISKNKDNRELQKMLKYINRREK